MPVHFLTFHAYRSWMPDHPRGYTSSTRGVLPPNLEMAQIYRRRAKHGPVVFSPSQQELIVGTLRVICDTHDLRLHYAVAMPTHSHALVSWRRRLTLQTIYNLLKQHCGYTLAQDAGTTSRPYFSRGGGDDRKAVVDRRHFDFLMSVYLPDHKGVHWREAQDQRAKARG